VSFPIDTSGRLVDVYSDWIEQQLASAQVQYPSVGIHVYWAPSMLVLSPTDDFTYQLGVDPIFARMAAINEFSAAGQSPRQLVMYIITPTDSGDANSMTHFLTLVTWASIAEQARGMHLGVHRHPRDELNSAGTPWG
jgi:hypothetical protein